MEQFDIQKDSIAQIESFDIQNALTTISANFTDRDEWQKFQDEQRAKVTVTDGRIELGQRMVKSAVNDEQIAYGYSLLGDYETACEIHSTAEYEEIREAIDRPDTQDCSCPLKQKGHPTRFNALTFYSPKRKCYLNLMTCSLCGFKNAIC